MSDRQVFRSTGAVVLWWAWLAFAVAVLAGLAVDGRGRSGVVTAVLVAAVTGLLYGCAQWPRIVADENGICVLNPLRSHAVPWAAVVTVDVVSAVRVHAAPAPGAARGPVIYSWAVQSSARARLKSEAAARRRAQGREPRGARQAAYRPAAYAKLPPQALEALERTHAEFVARQLDERAARERERPTAPAAAGASPQAAAISPEAAAVSPEAGQVRVTWAWAPIAVMAFPLLALFIAVLA